MNERAEGQDSIGPLDKTSRFSELWIYIAIGVFYYLTTSIFVRYTDASWVIGYWFISHFFGHLFAGAIYFFVANSQQRWSSCLTGFVERTFFCLAVAKNVGGAAVAMIGWVTLKHVFYLKDYFEKEKDHSEFRYQNLTLLSSITSLFFAMLGGVYCRDLEFQSSVTNLISWILL